MKLQLAILRAAVQTLCIIDAAVTTLLLVAVMVIGVLIPKYAALQGTSQSSILSAADLLNANSGHVDHNNTCYTYNSTDVYWWYYAEFQLYQKTLRRVGNVLDTTFFFVLFIIVVSDVVLVRGVDLTTHPNAKPRCIWYWLSCNTFVIMMLPILSVLSVRVAGATGALKDCGIGCNLPYFYVTYRVLFGLLVVMYLCKLLCKLEKDRLAGKVYKSYNLNI